MRKRYLPILIVSALVLVLSIVSCKTEVPPVEYSVTYDLNGGAWKQNLFVPSSYMSNDESVYRIPDPERRGYDFAGWTVSSVEGAVIARDAKDFVVEPSLGANLILSAKWKPVTYTISYDETIVESLEPEPVIVVAVEPEGPIFRTTYTVEDVDFILPEPLPKTGLDFLGWREKPEETIPNMKYLVITSRARNYVFEAVWMYHEYNISYDLAGGTWDGEVPVTSFIMTDEAIRIPAPVRDDYDFIGWKVKDSGDEPSVHYFVDCAGCADVALEAVWAPHRYTISLVNPDVKDDIITLGYTIQDDPFVLPALESPYYTFAGWYEEGSGNDPVVDYLFTPADGGDYVFLAAWAPVVYHIEYDLAGGYLPYDIVNPDTFTIETESFTLVEPRKENYVFLGWIISGDKNLTLYNPLTIEEGSVGDIKLYAIFQWRSVELGDVTSMQQMLPVLGKYGIPRPNWVVSVPEDDYWHYEKGYAKADTFTETMNLAKKQALLAVAEWCGTDVFEYYYSDGETSTDDRYIDTAAGVYGREVAEYWEDSEGGVWVLLRVPAYQNGLYRYSFFDYDGYDDCDYLDDYDDYEEYEEYEDFDQWFTNDDEDDDEILSLLTLLFGE